MGNSFHVDGWSSDPVYFAESLAARIESGEPCLASSFGASVDSQLVGSFSRAIARGCTGVFLRDRELAILGQHRRPMFQKRGTCVSRGMARGLQTSLDVAIVDNFSLLKTVEISFAPIYTLARIEVGKRRCGYGDGAFMCDAAKAVHDFGSASIDLFPGLTEDQVEDLAVRYADPRQSTPPQWINACRGHTSATFKPDSLDLLLDCITAGYAVPYACGKVTAMPNREGVSHLGDDGGHARCFVGWWVMKNGKIAIESSESWGSFPARNPQLEDQTIPVDQIPCVTIDYAGGRRKLAPGNVGVFADEFWYSIDNGGEAWAVSAPHFQPGSLAETLTN